MRLTSFTDFGLGALMRMAAKPDRTHSTTEIASEFGILRNHLTKAVAVLAPAGIVETRLGTGGGAILTRSPDRLPLGDIVVVLERGSALVKCLARDGGVCSIMPICHLKGLLADARVRFLNDLNRHTLADHALLSRSDDAKPSEVRS